MNQFRFNNMARYANRKSAEIQNFVILWVRLPPVLLGSEIEMARSSIGLGFQLLKLARWVRFPYKVYDKIREVVSESVIVAFLLVENVSVEVELSYTKYLPSFALTVTINGLGDKGDHCYHKR